MLDRECFNGGDQRATDTRTPVRRIYHDGSKQTVRATPRNASKRGRTFRVG